VAVGVSLFRGADIGQASLQLLLGGSEDPDGVAVGDGDDGAC